MYVNLYVYIQDCVECCTYRRATTVILVIISQLQMVVTHLATRVTWTKSLLFYSSPLPYKTCHWEIRKVLLL